MLAELVLFLLTINLMKTVSTQYYANPYGYQFYKNMPQQYFQEQQQEIEDMDYEEPIEHEHTRRYNRYKKYGSSGGKLPTIDDEYDRSDECKCSCDRCRDTYRPPKPCCKEVCNSCSERQTQQRQGSVVFVPYPYPLMVPSLTTNETTTSTTSTTTTAKAITIEYLEPDKLKGNKNIDIAGEEMRQTNTKRQRKNSAEIINDLILKSHLRNDQKYILTTMRKTRPTWEPKYNIVPIPDHLAEKLMSQLRQVRELQARRF